MEDVSNIVSAEAFAADILHKKILIIGAIGTVSTSGWSNPQLSPVIYIKPPADGIWDFHFVAEPPHNMALDVMLPIAAHYEGYAPDWLKGVRLHSASNDVVVSLKSAHTVSTHAFGKSARLMGGAHVERSLAVYDDSFQPTGTIHWGGGFPPVPHVEMKKLRHELTIVADGPDEAKIRQCIDTAIGAGLLAAIIAAFASGGLAAAEAFLSSALASLTGCLGESYKVRIVDRSHWIYWDT